MEDSKLDSVNLDLASEEEEEEDEEDDVMKELENFVKHRRKTQINQEGADVYEMCD